MTRVRTTWDRFTSLPDCWHPYDDGPDYAQANVLIDKGCLHLAVNADPGRGAAGWLGPKDALYGRWTIGASAIGGSGTGAVALLWPTSDVWAEGEIDWPEGDFDGPPNLFHHRMTAGREAETVAQMPISASWRDRHLYSTAWTPTSVKYYLDGVLLDVVTTDVPSTPHRYTVQLKPKPGSLAGVLLIDAFTYEPWAS